MNLEESLTSRLFFLQYFQLLSAIPTDLKRQALESSNAVLRRDSFISRTLKISEDVILDLMNLRCKNYYKLITETSTAVPTSIKTCEKQFPVISDNWQKGFSYISAASQDNKLREYSFKCLHRIITTRKEFKRCKLSDDDLCPRCSNPDSIEHTFINSGINCPDSNSFYNLTLGWFNGMHNTKIDLCSNHLVCYMFMENLFTSNLTIPQKRKLDILLLYQKKYTYRCEVLEKNLDLNHFINKIYLQWKLENCGIL